MIPPLLEKSGVFVVDDLVGISLLTASAFKKGKKPFLLVTPNLYKAQKLYSFICSILPSKNIYLFPSDELIRAESISQSKEMAANRIYILNQILNKQADIVICNVSSFTRFIPAPNSFKRHVLRFKVGENYSLEEVKTAAN